jgi:hypothetical protein
MLYHIEVYMRTDINHSHLLSAHPNADIKNHYLQVWMQMLVLGYADTDSYFIYLFNL